VSISSPFIDRPIATTLLTAAVAFAGALAYTSLPVSPLPQVEFPTISVSGALPGASPETMASSVATPLERFLGRIAGVNEMTSSSNLGTTSIVLQFDLSRDIDAAARDVQAAINAARSQLPSNLPTNPTYRKVNPADAPILILSLTSDTYDRARIYDAASSILQQKLAQIEGVGQVTVGGGALPAVRVEVNPTLLNNIGMDLEDIRTVLTNSNANRPKGDVRNAERTWEIGTTDQLLKASEYGPLIIAYRNGAAVPLSQVAEVRDGVEDIRTLGLVNGKPAIPIIIFRQPGANIISTVDHVRALIPTLQASIPPGIRMAVVLDRTTTIRESVRDVEISLALSIVLVVFVVFVFLRNPRTTLIPSIAVPISLIGTFSVMYLAGYSLDNLSLMALAIATGFVVDDAIVVIENIARHLEQGKTPMDAALIGAAEIGFTVLSISLSLVAVFIPILLMGGIVGRLFREFAVTLSVAIGVSLLVSLTTTPMMCARLLRPESEITHGRMYHWSERFFQWIIGIYDRTLTWVLRHQPLMLLVTLGTIAFTVYLYFIVPKGFFPQQDTGRLIGSILADQNTSFQSMSEKLREFADGVSRDPAVEDVIAFTGGAGTANTGRMFVSLKDLGARKASADKVIGRLRRKLSNIPGATLYLQSVQDVRVGGRASNAQYQYTLQGDDLGSLIDWTPRVYSRLRTLPGLADVNSDQQNSGPEIALNFDRATAARLGIAQQAIDNTLYDAFGQRPVSTIYTGLNQYHVIMEADPRLSEYPGALRFIYVRASAGGQVPLSAFARYDRSTTPLSISHQGQFPSSTISFNLLPGYALGDAVEEINQAELDMGLPATITGSFTGTAQAYRESAANEPFLIAAALLAVYIVLGVLYESLVHPVTILSTLPSAGVGALLALLMFRIELSIMALIGIILLIGIVKKNAILMIDFALAAERGEGKSPVDSIHQACLLRFRPIMMTTMAALLGALPLAIGTGTGSELRRPLGIAIIGGLIFSQMLTLYTTPVVYLYLDRLAIRLRSGRRFQAPAPGDLAPLVLVVFLFSLSACTVGPKYKVPASPATPNFKEPPPANWKEAQPQDSELRGNWWEAFGDSELNTLEDQVNVSNENIAAAEARFRSARAAVRIARAGLFPTVTAGANATTSRVSANRANSGALVTTGPTTLYELPIDASYEVDVWGRVRRTIEANAATAQATAADLETIRLSMHAELAQDYFQMRGLDEEEKLFRATITADQQALQLTTNQYNQGFVSQVDVAQAQTQLDTVRAEATDLGVARSQFEHAIAVVTGKPPAEVTIAAAPLPVQPPVIPVALPSQLLERRPDVASAERQAAAANALIGVAKSAYFPTLSLSFAGGVQSAALSNLLTLPSRFWSVGPALVETVFDGGARRGLTQEAQANYDMAVAVYRQSVLSAFQDVEDNLAALRILADEAAQQDVAVTSSQHSVDLSLNRYRGGITTYLEVITAQNVLLVNQRTAVDIQARRMVASVLLVKALGGGWKVANLPPVK
jgi:hydrophobe/amphiphile efflux-1 (HAE1) family protein/NodT family efflux transporter outer membrane factor (OMF) lipoprotein